MADTTVLLPIKRDAPEKEEAWLKEAIASLPKDTPYLVLRNDGEYEEALNAGLEAAKTEFVMAMGADDILDPKCIPFLEEVSWNADVVYPAMPIINEDREPIGLHEAVPFCPIRLQQMNYVSGGSLYRREKALALGGYRALGGMEDWDLWVRMMRSGARFKPAPNARYFYRIREGSMNSKVREDAEFRMSLRDKIIGKPDPLADAKATFYAQATPAVTYLRAQLPARYLPGMVTTDLHALANAEEVLFPDHLGDTAIFLHPGDKNRAAIMQVFRNEGVRTLVEVDDNYLINPGQTILKRAGWGLKIGDQPFTRDGHRWITKNSDGIIVTTEALARSYRKVNPNVYVCPNTVDPADWEAPEKPDDGIFRIGWIAALAHKPDIPLVTRAFDWASRQKDVEVYVTSSNPMTGAEGLDPRWKFDHGLIPWTQDLDAYRKLFSYFDVIVAPIIPNPFSIYRSDVKALEAAMGLACPVLSDVPPYEDWTDDRCMKVKDAKGFYHAIKHLVANRDDAKQLAQAARDYTLKERTTAAQIDLWKEAIAG
jgi:hypothetical protein